MPKLVDHARQRRELATTAAEVVAECGLEQTTLRAVAARHGCTKGMVQHYFADKNALLMAVLEQIEEVADARMPVANGQLEGLELVHARLASLLPASPAARREWQVRLAFTSASTLSKDIKSSISRRRDARQRATITGLRSAQKIGELRHRRSLLNTCRALDALVSGIGLWTALDAAAYPPAVQRRILRTAIDDLRH